MDELKTALELLNKLQAAYDQHYLKIRSFIDSARRSLLNQQQQYGKQSELPLTSPTQTTDFPFDTSRSVPEQPTFSKPKTDFSLNVHEAATKSSNVPELIQKKPKAFRTLPAFVSSQKTKNGVVKPKFKLRVKKASVQSKMRVDKPTVLDNNSEPNAQAESSSLPSFNQGILGMFGNSESISSSRTDVSTSPSEQQSSVSGSSDPSAFSPSVNQTVTDSPPASVAPPLIEEEQAKENEVTVGYKCPVCNKVFKSPYYLKNSHMNVHNLKKPGKRFKCKYCSYTSAFHSNKYMHEKECAKKFKKVD